MKKIASAIVLAFLLGAQGGLLGQQVKDLLKDAKPATGVGEDLMMEAKQPRYYEFKLDTPVSVGARSVASDERGNRSVLMEVRSLTFMMDPRDNHLTAVAAILRVGVRAAVRTIHVALYDKEKRLLGTALCRKRIEQFTSEEGPVATPEDVALDFGASPRFFAADSFQVVIVGRGRSEYRYSEKDVDDLISRLANGDDPEAQDDAALWLMRIGEPVIPQLSVLARSGKPVAAKAIRALGGIGGPKVLDTLASILNDTQRPGGDRAFAAAALGASGEAGLGILEKRLKAGDTDEVVVGIFEGLSKSRQKSAARVLSECLMNPQKYHGKTRVQLILNIQEMGDPSAIPALIQALRDPAPRVRPVAARALEKVAKHVIPIKGEEAGPSELAWLNAPLDAREAAVKEWEDWWQKNKDRFGM